MKKYLQNKTPMKKQFSMEIYTGPTKIKDGLYIGDEFASKVMKN